MKITITGVYNHAAPYPQPPEPGSASHQGPFLVVACQLPWEPQLTLPASPHSWPLISCAWRLVFLPPWQSGWLCVDGERVSVGSCGDWNAPARKGPQCDPEPGEWSRWLRGGGRAIVHTCDDYLHPSYDYLRPSLVSKDSWVKLWTQIFTIPIQWLQISYKGNLLLLVLSSSLLSPSLWSSSLSKNIPIGWHFQNNDFSLLSLEICCLWR